MSLKLHAVAFFVPLLAAPASPAEAPRDADAADPVGIFDSHGDVGAAPHAGSVAFDKDAGKYTVTGGGENMWADRDAFHYVWKKVSGDLALTADVAFQGQGKQPHRKACLVIRQSLDADSPYVDAALHGDGLTFLQVPRGQGRRHARGSGQRLGPCASAPPRQGIYRLEGKSLTVCLAYPGRPRPTAFLAQPDVQQLRVYQRGGKADP